MESFEVSSGDNFGDILNRHEKKSILKVGVYTAGWFEYWRMYPDSLIACVNKDMETVVENIRGALGSDTEIIWPGLISTLDDADNAGRLFNCKRVDLIIFVAATYTSDVMSLQCLRYVENVPLIVLVRQSHRNIDFGSNYEKTLRNSGMIATSQLTATFRKMGIFDRFKVVVGVDNDKDVYTQMKEYFDAIKVYHYLRELNIGIIGHVFRGMFDHEFDRTRIKGGLGPNVINIQISHLLDIWEKVTYREIEQLKDENAWIKQYTFKDVTEQDFDRELRFAMAYKKLIRRYRLDAVCFLGQHYVEAKTGCTGNLANIILAGEKQYMVNTEGDVNGLIMMCIMNQLTGQTPLFGEWGEFGEKENAMQIMMHGYADPDHAKDPCHVKITRTPEEWGYTGKGFSIEFTAKPGLVTIGHFLDDRQVGWRMLISKGKAIDVEKSIPCEDVTLLFQPEKPVKEFITKLLELGVDHHAIICYGDCTRELGYIADLLGITKTILS